MPEPEAPKPVVLTLSGYPVAEPVPQPEPEPTD